MLKAEDILNGLQSIVNNNSIFAIIWHGVFYLLIAALLAKWIPSNRIQFLNIFMLPRQD